MQPLHTSHLPVALRRLSLAIALALPVAAPLTVQADSASADRTQKTLHFDIPAQPLTEAINAFIAASDWQVGFPAELAGTIKSHALSGSLTAEQALAQLLLGTGLAYRLDGVGNATLYKIATTNAPHSAADSATTLKPMTVYGTYLTDDPRSYRAAQSYSSTKTDTPLKETPQSIQVIKRALIDDQQNVTLSETLRNVSGVVTLDPLFTPAFQGTLVRGFSAEQLIDGFTQYYNPGDRESTVNIERIEVLKGSNGTLYSGGSGSPVGGLVNVISKLPQHKAFGEAGFKIGSDNFYQPYADINQPLNDNVLFRVTGEYTNADSHIDVIETQRWNINPSLTFTNNDDTTFTVQSKVSRWRQPDYQGLPATGTIAGNYKIRPETFIGDPDLPDSRADFDGVWGSLDHKINDIWSFNLKARYASSSFDEKAQILAGADAQAENPALPPATWMLANAQLYQEQEELSFLGNATAKFDLGPTRNTFLIGADHSDFEDKGFMDLNYGPTFTGIGTVNLLDPSFPVPYADPGPGQLNNRVLNTTYGGYFQLQSTIYERLHLLTGLRVGTVEIDYRNWALGAKAAAETEKTEWLPRVGGVIDLVDGLSVFASYTEGMRGQPYANFLGTPAPEMSRHAEAGLKFDFASQLTGQLAVYQIDRTNVAVRSAANPLFSVPDGKQRSRGFEGDLTWQASDALSFLANYAHTDARFIDSLGGTGVADGNWLARVPENSGRLWANYRFQQEILRGFSVGAGVYVQSDAYLSDNNRYKTDGYHSFDASLAYENKLFKVATTVKNFTNEDYFLPYGYLGGHVAPAAGTSVFATVSMRY